MYTGFLMLSFEYSHNLCRFTYSSVGEYDTLQQLLTPPNPPDNKGFVDTENHTIPTGLLDHSMELLRHKGIECVCTNKPEDNELFVCEKPDILDGITLDNIQMRTVNKMLVSKRGIVKVGTGGGKTEMALACLKTINRPSLILTTRVKHSDNMYERLIKRGFKSVGFLGDSKKTIGHITVAVVDTLFNEINMGNSKVIAWLNKVDVLIVDEAHRAAANRCFAVACMCPAKYRFYLSATPFDEKDNVYSNYHDMAIIGMSGRVIVNIPISYLIKINRAVPVHVMSMHINSPKMNTKNRNYHKVYEYGITKNHVRNCIITSLTYNLYKEPNNRILVLTKIIQHGQNLLNYFARLGINCIYSSGSTVQHLRDSVISEGSAEDNIHDAFFDGKPNVLIGSTIYDEAVDIQNITDIILAGADKKASVQEQRVGRGVRTFTGKIALRVWDFIDNQHWILSNQQTERSAVWRHPDNGFKSVIINPRELIAEGMSRLNCDMPSDYIHYS